LYENLRTYMRTIEKKFDVVVVGGGLAGVCAAIASSRHGCRTALIEARPVLGGNSSSLIRVPPSGAASSNPWARETGIIEEIMIEHQRRTPYPLLSGLITSQWDLVLYEWVRAERNLTLFLNTVLFDASVDERGRVEFIKALQIGSETMLKIYGKIFIDCTGDGTLGALVGAEYRIGRESRHEFKETPVIAPEIPDKMTQGSSIMFKAVYVDRPVEFKPPPWYVEYPEEDSLYKRDHSRGFKGLYHGFWWIEIGAPYDTIHDNEKIRDELLAHLLGVWDHLKNRGDHGAENMVLEWIGFIPGKRESRRLIGDYILTEHDLKRGELFYDRVAYGGWFIDVHTMGGILARDRPPEPLTGDEDLSDVLCIEPYSIPFRCLYSKNIENLLMAGRDISVTHVALGSTRVMKTCAVIGQAVGTAAALCIKYGITPRELCRRRISELQQVLLKDDCFIIGLKNEDENDLARGARVMATSHAQLILDPEVREGGLELERGQIFPLSSSYLNTISLWLRSELEEDIEVRIKLSKVSTIWSMNEPRTENFESSAVVPAGYEGWVEFPFNISIEPHRLYRITISRCPGLFWRMSKPLPGVCAGWKKPHWRRYRYEKPVYSMKIDPPSYPFTPENVINGYSRPYDWTNIWISDPNEPLPQSITLDFGEPVEFNTIYLTFDTNLHIPYSSLPPLYRFPECVKDYTIKVGMNREELKEIVHVENNYMRRRVHNFRRVRARFLEVEVLKTNGDRSARIYEIRVYNE